MFEKKESYRTAPQYWLILDPFKQGIVDSITYKQNTYSAKLVHYDDEVKSYLNLCCMNEQHRRWHQMIIISWQSRIRVFIIIALA